MSLSLRTHRWWWCLAWLAMAKALPTSAQSAPASGSVPESRVHLQWPTDAPCAPPAAADEEIARLLGDRYEQLAPTTFRVELEARGDSYELALHFSDADLDEAQRVTLHSCAEVQEAAVLLAAMSLAPSASPTPPVTPPPEPVPEAREALPLALRLDVGGVFDARSLPKISGGPAFGMSLTYGPWLSAVSGRYLVARDANHNSSDGIHTPVDLFAGALTLGYRAALPSVRFGPLGEVELGYLRGQSTGTEDAVTAGALWAALWGGLTLSSRWSESAASSGFPGLSRVELSLACLLGFPLSRARFAFADEPPFYTTAPVGFRVFLSASVALWTTETGRFGHSSSR